MTSISTVMTHHIVSVIMMATLFSAMFFSLLAIQAARMPKRVRKRHEIGSLVSVNSTLILGHYCQIYAKLLPIAFNLLNYCDFIRPFSVQNPINAEFVERIGLPCVAQVDLALNKATYMSPGLLGTIHNCSIWFQGSSLLKALYKSVTSALKFVLNLIAVVPDLGLANPTCSSLLTLKTDPSWHWSTYPWLRGFSSSSFLTDNPLYFSFTHPGHTSVVWVSLLSAVFCLAPNSHNPATGNPPY